MLHFTVSRRAVSTFRHKSDRPARRRIRQFIRSVIAPLVVLALVVVRIVAKTSVAVDSRLVLYDATELDRHLPRFFGINANDIVTPALWRPVTRRDKAVRASFAIRTNHFIQHRHARMPAVIVAPASVATCRKFVISPRLLVQSLFCRCIFERRVLHRQFSKLLVQAVERPAVHHHHRGKRRLLHAAVFPVADGFHPDPVHFVRTLVATTKFFFQMLQELPVAIAVSRGTVIKERVVDQVFRTMCIVRIILVRHPVRMAFGKPSRMAVVAHPACDSLQSVCELM